MCSEDKIQEIVRAELAPVLELLSEHDTAIVRNNETLAGHGTRITSIEDWQKQHAAWSETTLNNIMTKFDSLAETGKQQTALLQELVTRVDTNATVLTIHDRKLSPRRQLWYGVTQVWDNRRKITKALIVVGGVAAALGQMYTLWALLAERLVM